MEGIRKMGRLPGAVVVVDGKKRIPGAAGGEEAWDNDGGDNRYGLRPGHSGRGDTGQ